MVDYWRGNIWSSIFENNWRNNYKIRKLIKVNNMSKRKDFEIEYQKEIDRCKKKMAIYSANGSMANDVVALIKDRIEKAEIARQSRDASGMVAIYNELKVLRT